MRYLFLVLACIILLIQPTQAATRRVVHTYTTPNHHYYGANNNLHYINNKLSNVESSIYGRTYENQNANIRLNRLEKTVFNRTYPNLPFEQRLNNVIVNYNNIDNTQNINQRRFQGLTNAVGSMLFGTSTGMTPQVNPYWDNYSAPGGIQNDITGTRGWYHNAIQRNNGCGVTIID